MKRKIPYFVLIFIITVFLYGATKKTIENYRLARIGILTKAVVTNKKKVGGKGTIDLTVLYNVSGQKYEGTLTNENYYLGDSLEIVYLKSNPLVIRSYRFIKDNYTTTIK
jgi:hypothetical protein